MALNDLIIKEERLRLPGCPVVRSPLPVKGMGHVFSPWFGKIPHASGQLGPCTTTTEATCPKTHALQQEKPPKSEAPAQLESSPGRPSTAKKRESQKIRKQEIQLKMN